MSNSSGVPLEVDMFVEEPMDFETLWEKREQRAIGSTRMQVIDRESLIELKRRSGRPQDLQDIAELERLRDE